MTTPNTNKTAPTTIGYVLRLISKSRTRGVTCDEAELTLNLSHQTCSARFYDLRQRGAIVDSGKKRPTRTGRKATVWVVG